MARAYGSSATLLLKRETTYGQAADCDDPCEFIPMNPKRKRERFLTDTEFTRLGHLLDEASGKGSRIRRECDKLDQRTGPAPRPPRLRATC